MALDIGQERPTQMVPEGTTKKMTSILKSKIGEEAYKGANFRAPIPQALS